MKAEEGSMSVVFRADGHFRGKDITGQRFGRLTALYPLKERSKKRYVIWHCRCDCGNEADFSYNALMYSNLRSCGCKRQKHVQELPRYLVRVDGTSIDRLRSTKIPKSNTTGIKGVYHIRGKYVAKLVFQKKQYYLGTYDTATEAAKARKEAEESVKETVLSCYTLWKERADRDPEWALKNPVHIAVERNDEGRLNLTFSPDIE